MAGNGSVSEPGRGHHPPPAGPAGAGGTGGAGGAGSPGGADAALRRRRAAITELGDALRELVGQATATEVGEDELRRVAAQVRDAAALLGRRTRTRGELPGADNLLGGFRMYNPAAGRGSALVPPLHIKADGNQVVGTCSLSLAYEGPPTFAHGGVSAMLLDQMLGHATGMAGRPGMTVKLEMRYRAPVPLQTPLRLTAAVAEVNGRRVTARGTIATAGEPDAVLVEATGLFIGLRAEQAARLFGGVHPDATNPLIAHD